MSCPYHDESQDSVMSGIYCKKKGYVGVQFWRCYCQSHHGDCPYNGGSDPDELVYQKPADPEPKKSHSSDYDDDYGMGSSSGGSSSGSSSGSSLTLMDLLGAFATYIKILLICFLLTGVLVLIYFTGAFGPWAQLQLPEGANTQGLSVYAVRADGKGIFKVRTGKYKKDNLCKTRGFYGYSDIYMEQDGASVWLGTAHLTPLNTAVVEDISYDEIQQQMVRTVIVQLQDGDKVPLKDVPLEIIDPMGNSLQTFRMEDGRYAVMLPNSVTSTTLSFHAEGYQSLDMAVDLSNRLVEMILTLAKEG